MEPNTNSNVETNTFFNKLNKNTDPTILSNHNNNMNSISGSFSKTNNFFNNNNTNNINAPNTTSSTFPTSNNTFIPNTLGNNNNPFNNVNNYTFTKPSGSISFLNNNNKENDHNAFSSTTFPKSNNYFPTNQTSFQNNSFLQPSTNPNFFKTNSNNLTNNINLMENSNFTQNRYNHFPTTNTNTNTIITNPNLLNKSNSINFSLNNPQKDLPQSSYNYDYLGVYSMINEMKRKYPDNMGNSIEDKKKLKFNIPEELLINIPKKQFPTTTTIVFPPGSYYSKENDSNDSNYISKNMINSFNFPNTSKQTKSNLQTENNKLKQKQNIVSQDKKESNKLKNLIPQIKPLESSQKKPILNYTTIEEIQPKKNENVYDKILTEIREEMKNRPVYKPKDLITLNFTINETILQDTIQLTITNQHNIGSLKAFLAETLTEKLNFELKADDLEIISKHASLKDHEIIKDKEFFSEKDILIIILNESFCKRFEDSKKEKNNSIKVDLKELNDNNDLYSINLISNISENIENKKVLDERFDNIEFDLEEANYKPILTKIDYNTRPSIDELMRMSKTELEKVENFCISNEYGEVEFPGFTDLTYVNLDEVVHIDYKSISLYHKLERPEIGQKLNRKALLKFFQFFNDKDILENDKEFKIYIESLNRMAESLNVINIINKGYCREV